MIEPNPGSRWSAYDGNVFHILAVVELEGHTWVHYIKEGAEPQEYSCYLESFLSRFTELPQ